MIVGKDETIGGLLNEGGERGTLDCEAKTQRRLIVGKRDFGVTAIGKRGPWTVVNEELGL